MAEAIVIPEAANYRVAARIRQHTAVLDEPEEKGGKDTAPTPTEMVCAALAACTAITLQMYLQHKKWDVKVASVMVHYETTSGAPTFRREVKLQGANEQQVPRLTAVANSCPVHKMLSAANTIQTTVLN